LLAAIFLEVSGLLIKYSQEARIYSFLLCLALFSMWLFVRFFISARQQSFEDLVAYHFCFASKKQVQIVEIL
jgi:uncharacterized membrane protein